MRLHVDLLEVDVAAESQFDGNHRLRPIDVIPCSACNVDNSNAMDLADANNEIVVVNVEDVMVVDDEDFMAAMKKYFASLAAGLMRVSIH
ncbi:unnamed protein product [Sphagnum troendelagicum]|uniref:Uncharacterized protein n=1 Tax=Sphagnum troendelagicum TaxID=128251 RepID=A0ABP0THQ9_9BRYO